MSWINLTIWRILSVFIFVTKPYFLNGPLTSLITTTTLFTSVKSDLFDKRRLFYIFRWFRPSNLRIISQKYISEYMQWQWIHTVPVLYKTQIIDTLTPIYINLSIYLSNASAEPNYSDLPHLCALRLLFEVLKLSLSILDMPKTSFSFFLNWRATKIDWKLIDCVSTLFSARKLFMLFTIVERKTKTSVNFRVVFQ